MQTNSERSSRHFSILIALVSSCGRERVLEVLTALRAQRGGHRYEVILGDRRQDGISTRIRESFPEATLFPASAADSIPAILANALARSSAELVVVTEDHCIPEPDWLDGFAHVFQDTESDVAAVGGAVLNAYDERTLDWATFLCEYAAFHPPIRSGPARALPGMNVCYRREVLVGLDRDLLTRGFWDRWVHPRLLAEGRRLVLADEIRVRHAKPMSFQLFTSQRFLYSRSFGGQRFERRDGLRRAIGVLACPLLVPWLLLRQTRIALARPKLRRHFCRCLFYLLWFDLVSAAGEGLGYLRGPADSMERLE